ncbi:hypothetical protein [Sodalis-like endosymbiont of Proechinophthirus fluctus]|uniref:hypothetical protein n=1 Tax=Sodalis-like endosymbiont of Proechinophthirus fluctus TaxID=1462730 RepID=UPI000A653361
MKPQTDPTVIYGMGENYCRSITRQDLTTPMPYNTYIIVWLLPPADCNARLGFTGGRCVSREKPLPLLFVADRGASVICLPPS